MGMIQVMMNKFGYTKKGMGTTAADTTFWKTIRQLKSLGDDGENVEDPYKKSVWVYSSINAIATNIGSVPFRLYTTKTKDKKSIVEEGQMYELFANPNPYYTESENVLKVATMTYLEVFGECFWVFEGRDNITQIPTEIYPMNPTRFTPMYVSTKEGKKFTGYWQYDAPDTTPDNAIIFAPHQVLHIRYFNPYDDIRGLSPIEASRMGVNQDYFSSKFNENFFKEGAAIGGIIEVEDTLNQNEFETLRMQFEDRHKGYDKAHKVAVLTGGASFKEVKMSQRDMEFISLKTITRGEILAAFKTNEVVLGNYENIQCLSPDTEILTNNGFVYAPNVKVGDMVATLSPDKKIEYKEVTKTYIYDYKGTAYTQNKDEETNIDYLITPEHKLYGHYENSIQDIFVRISDIEDSFYSYYDNNDLEKTEIIKPKKVEYDGKVYCIEVPPYHTMMTRYNGKVMWTGNSYEGIRMAHQSFWRETLVPKMLYLEDVLWSKFFSKIDKGKIWGGFDLSGVQALQEDYNNKVAAAEILNKIGVPLNEISKRLDLGFPEFEWGKVWWVPASLIPATTAMQLPTPEEDPDPGYEPEDEPEPGPAEPESPTDDDDADVIEDEPVKDSALWDRYIWIQSKYENNFKSKLKKYFFEQRKNVLKNLNNENLLDKEKETTKLQNIFSKMYVECAKSGIQMIYDELGKDYTLKDIPNNINKEMINRNNLIAVKIVEGISNILLKVLEKSVENEDSIEEMAAKIKEIYNKFSGKINTIARCESAAIINMARYYTMISLGVKKHKWISRKEGGRILHKEYNQKDVDLGKSFDDSFVLLYPTYYKAPIEETINCLCFTIPII